MPEDLSPLIAASTQWLTRAYPSDGGAFTGALREAQARQAVTVAAWLRYPTPMDVALVSLAGPGGSARLDWVTGADAPDEGPGADGADGTVGADDADGHAWRTWVDEVVVSWAACLLADPVLAATAVAALADGVHTAGMPVAFRRLVAPGEHDRRAAALLRHPDLLAPVAGLHRRGLLDRLRPGRALTA